MRTSESWCAGSRSPAQMVRLLVPILFALFALVPSVLSADLATSNQFHFEVVLKPGLLAAPVDGRLFVVIAQTNYPEPRIALERTGPDAPQSLARDLKGFSSGTIAILDQNAFAFPVTNISLLPTGDYVIQAVFDSNSDLRSPNSPGNLYSSPLNLRLDFTHSQTARLELTGQIPPEELPAETGQIKFAKIQSKLLTQFHGRPIFLRAGVILPRDYDRDPARRYPLWVRIGGFNTRYRSVVNLMNEGSQFRKTWLADDTPRFILLQLDGAGPLGDSYQMDSDNNGPYGEALIRELIPEIEARFRAAAQPRARFLSGTSTGGWVALALQVFYPDFFNGAWSSCPDPVDFRSFELVNIYDDENAFTDKNGNERASERDLQGRVVLTMRQEVGAENLLGRGNSYVSSGGQWGVWNAVYGPRGPDALPVPLWDPHSGKINRTVAEHWKKYDLRLVLDQNWNILALKLRGKLHIASGEADQYFLNNAVHLLDESLRPGKPPLDAKIAFGPGKGHGWSNLSMRQMLDEMKTAADRTMP